MANKDRVELLKLKQGIVTEEEAALDIEKPPPLTKPTGKAAWDNFVYHHKIHLIIGGFVFAVIAILGYLALTDKKPDVKLLLISDCEAVSEFFHFELPRLRSAIEHFTPDYDGNGYVYADCMVIDIVDTVGGVPRNRDLLHANTIKLFGEVRSGEVLLYIGNLDALVSIPGEDGLDDFYVTFAAECGTEMMFFPLNRSALRAAEGFSFRDILVPNDMVIAVRKSNNEARLERAVDAFIRFAGIGLRAVSAP